MNAIRGWVSLAIGLCLCGTALAQYQNPLRENAPAYGVRMTRLEDPSHIPMDQAPSYYGSNNQTPSYHNGAPEQVATPAPVYGQPGSIFDEAFGGGYGCGDECGCCMFLPSWAGGGQWYGYVGGLTMGRNSPNDFWTTYETGNNANQLMHFPNADWGGGVDTRIGYWFGCGAGDPCNPCGDCCGGRFGIEAIYWGVWGLDGQSALYDPANRLSTPIDLGNVYFGDPLDTADLWFDNARSHRLTRNDEVHNVEINFLYLPCCNPCSRFQLTALAGIRYFRFTEGLQFGTLSGFAPTNAQFGDDPVDEAFLDVDVQNNLVGFQIGAYGNYQIHNRFSIFAVPKIGIYGNHITGTNSLYTGNGVVATFSQTGNRFDFDNSRNVFSMLGSIDVGFNWAFTQNCSLIGGYRVVAVSNIALSDNQIPAFLAAEDEWSTINPNGDLILHGAFAGLEVRF